MTHMHVPTVPTARDRRLAAQQSGRHARTFRKHERQLPFDSENIARCTGETRADMSTPGDGMGRMLRRCQNSACPRHAPEAYSDCMARHTPETLVESAAALGYLSQVRFIGRYVDVDL